MLQVEKLPPVPPACISRGRLTRVVGLQVAATGLNVGIGSYCRIYRDDLSIEAEVVGFSGVEVFLLPVDQIEGLQSGDWVEPLKQTQGWPVGPSLIGRVIDSRGRPMDGLGMINAPLISSLIASGINPIERAPVARSIDVGVRTINACFSIGRGQRMGLMASSGLGKSVLLGMMSRFTEADVVVVGLIGERGREVQEFLTDNLGQQGLAKSVVVVAPADTPALMRINAARYATKIAAVFRDQGMQVLLLIDSLSRFAQAQREVGLAIGEPAANQGYPPSVFAKIPELVEQAGNSDSHGSLTAVYTLLDEQEGRGDAVIESAKAILDGHIVLSRSIAEQGIYPAIDMERSISRVMRQVVEPEQVAAARDLIGLISLYFQKRDLVLIGAYESGTDAKLDKALALYPKIVEFLSQSPDSAVSTDESVRQLLELVRNE